MREDDLNKANIRKIFGVQKTTQLLLNIEDENILREIKKNKHFSKASLG